MVGNWRCGVIRIMPPCPPALPPQHCSSNPRYFFSVQQHSNTLEIVRSSHEKNYYTSQIIHSSLDTRYKDLRKTLKTHEGQTLLWANQIIYKGDGRDDDDDDDLDSDEKGGEDVDDDLVFTKSMT